MENLLLATASGYRRISSDSVIKPPTNEVAVKFAIILLAKMISYRRIDQIQIISGDPL